MEEQADAEQERSSCPSPSMQSAPPQQQQQYPSSYSQQQQQQQNASEQPSASMQHAPLLPPIQHFEGVPQYVAMNGVPPPMQHHPPPYPPTLYGGYGGSGGMAAPSNGMMRYAAIPQAPVDARQMSGGRHKKEIKRRTKTGCLTCRKRRIKVRTSDVHSSAHMNVVWDVNCDGRARSSGPRRVKRDRLGSASESLFHRRPSTLTDHRPLRSATRVNRRVVIAPSQSAIA